VEKYVFLALVSSKRDDKSAYGNGKRPFVQDSNGEANLAITVSPNCKGPNLPNHSRR
jgi:hypothetical protein